MSINYPDKFYKDKMTLVISFLDLPPAIEQSNLFLSRKQKLTGKLTSTSY